MRRHPTLSEGTHGPAAGRLADRPAAAPPVLEYQPPGPGYEWTAARVAFAMCAAEHALVLLFAGALLDGGRAARLCVLASAVFWGGFVGIVLRRRGLRFGGPPLVYVACGYPLLLVLVHLLAVFVT